MVSVSSVALTLLAVPAVLAQFLGGGMVGSESVSSGSYYNSETSFMPGVGGMGYGGMGYGGMGYGGMGYGGMGYGGMGYGGMGYGGVGYGGLGGYGGYGGYGGMGYGGYGGLGGLGGYGYGRGVGVVGASTGGAAIIGPSGSIIVGPQSAGGTFF
ncbi:hypothetical protein IWW39_002877 [Coemansia spiralis]|uniref:Uncharacterized protein n=1 Tax=Coemansia spiralis TaxID=417178 RepID=A0A9W8GKD9_9FUNG|nr:hypothetical protein IWW39_002877 [Coemansia spiralis]